jgi:two-component system chemotaxis response regulator CheY
VEEIVGADIFIDEWGREPLLSFRAVLLVDDSSSTRMIVAKMLRAIEGLEVLQAGSAAEAFALLHKNPVDLVLADINMPGIDGLKLLSAIRSKPALASTVVLLMTASRQTTLVGTALASGADGYLLKPFTAEQLRAAINKAALRRASASG